MNILMKMLDFNGGQLHTTLCNEIFVDLSQRLYIIPDCFLKLRLIFRFTVDRFISLLNILITTFSYFAHYLV